MHSIIALIIIYFFVGGMKKIANDTMPKSLRYIKYFIIKRPSSKWRTRHSIYAQIIHNPSKPNLCLIDERHNQKFKLSYGMADALWIYDGPDIDDDKISQLSLLFSELAHTGNRSAGTKIYEIIQSFSVYSFKQIAEDITDNISGNKLNIFPYLYYYARDLVKYSTNRNAVKLGLSIMAMCRQKHAIKIAMRVGCHEEFGLWSVNAIKALGQTTNRRVSNKIFKLAKRLCGWGQIAILWNNAKCFTTKCQKDWLFFEATKTFLDYHELPDVCIKYGEFAKRMSQNKISQQTFDAATNIIDLYLDYGEDLSFNEMRPFCDWIRHAQYRIKNARDLYILFQLTRYMAKRNRHFVKIRMQSETKGIINIANRILEQAPIRDIILRDIKENKTCYSASKLIVPFGKDLFDELWNMLKLNPYKLSIWEGIMNCMRVQTPRRYKIKRLIVFANDILSVEPDIHTDILTCIRQNIARYRFLSKSSALQNLIKLSQKQSIQ